MRPHKHYGSLTQSGTMRIGSDDTGRPVYVPIHSMLPMVHPNDLEVDGWDIHNADLYRAMQRAQVLDVELQERLRVWMEPKRPRPSIYYPDFIAANQAERANHVLRNASKQEDLEQIRSDIRDFRKRSGVERIVLLWTANTERFCEVRAGLNTTANEVLASIQRNESEIAPSQIFAVAACLEGCIYLNGSPQNTLVPGIVEDEERARRLSRQLGPETPIHRQLQPSRQQ